VQQRCAPGEPVGLIQISADGRTLSDYPSAGCAAQNMEADVAGWWHEHRVRERAYEIWERSGRPEGKSVEHWLRAEAEIAADEQGLEQELKLEAEGVV
jgi:DUF2934 family protein